MMTSAPTVVEAMLGGWQFDGIWNWRTGLPLTIASPACANCAMGGDRTTRADAVPGVSPSVADPNAQAWFNPAAFNLQSTPYGTVGRDTIWGPGAQQWDLGVAKKFTLIDWRWPRRRPASPRCGSTAGAAIAQSHQGALRIVKLHLVDTPHGAGRPAP